MANGKKPVDARGGKPKKVKEYVVYVVTVYVYASGGYNDPANATPLPSFEVKIRTGPSPYHGKNDIDKITEDIVRKGYIYTDEDTGLKTHYPPNRISHVEAEELDD